MEERISKTPGVCGGGACIRKTRIPVWLVISFLRQTLSLNWDWIIRDYPQLSREDIRAAVDYYETHTEEIDRDIYENEVA